ncbi:MAG: hypothetical protein WC241_04615 [Candidatus Paceibacterota bacterium]|jgi:hypothetical protein
MLLFIEKGINVSECLIRRPDLDRPPIRLPVNNVLLPQTVAFECSDGTIMEMSREIVNALGIYGQVKRMTYINSGKYVKKVWDKIRSEKLSK